MLYFFVNFRHIICVVCILVLLTIWFVNIWTYEILETSNIYLNAVCILLCVESRSDRARSGSIFARSAIARKYRRSKSQEWMSHSSLEQIRTPHERVFQSITFEYVLVKVEYIRFALQLRVKIFTGQFRTENSFCMSEKFERLDVRSTFRQVEFHSKKSEEKRNT